jgi:hypothetical protein
MRHKRSYHADVLHTEPPTLTEATPLNNYGSVVANVGPDLLDELVSCRQGNR